MERNQLLVVVNVLVAMISVAQAQSPVVRPGNKAALIKELSIGGFVDRSEPLAPCEPDLPLAFSDVRLPPGFFAARFRVLQRGTGSWTLEVNGRSGTLWRRAVGADAPNLTLLQTDLLAGDWFEIRLEGPADPAAKCPVIRLES